MIVAGPLFARVAYRWGPMEPPADSALFSADDEAAATGDVDAPGRRTPGFWVTVGVVRLPVLLMRARAVA